MQGDFKDNLREKVVLSVFKYKCKFHEKNWSLIRCHYGNIS